MLLRAEYPNGHFGDSALYLWDITGKGALLMDCGDLSRFSTRQLLRVTHIFISHCHMDHFFGFDLFLRVHIGSLKVVRIFGPPGTRERVGGKLQGYTWNLVLDQNFGFEVVDLDPSLKKKTLTRFHSRDAFRASEPRSEDWDPITPVVDLISYKVWAAFLDHRTLSVAYAVEEKPSVWVDQAALETLGLVPGPWIGKLKAWRLFGGGEGKEIQVIRKGGGVGLYDAQELSEKVLIPRHRHKISYVTDGVASDENRRRILELIPDSDILYCETCFLEADRSRAEETQHFTAEFMGKLAREAGVKRLVPIHFSKRYLDRPEGVIEEVARHFQGEVVFLHPSPRQQTL